MGWCSGVSHLEMDLPSRPRALEYFRRVEAAVLQDVDYCATSRQSAVHAPRDTTIPNGSAKIIYSRDFDCFTSTSCSIEMTSMSSSEFLHPIRTPFLLLLGASEGQNILSNLLASTIISLSTTSERTSPPQLLPGRYAVNGRPRMLGAKLVTSAQHLECC